MQHSAAEMPVMAVAQSCWHELPGCVKTVETKEGPKSLQALVALGFGKYAVWEVGMLILQMPVLVQRFSQQSF